LDDGERSCLARYVEVLEKRLGGELEEIVVFGSVARGEAWPRGMRIRSDLDLLVVTRSQVSAETEDELIHATMPLFLECGRQLGPHFRTRESLERPNDERDASFVANVERDGITIYRR
jgi:predicted nucleotidyltransferase